MNKDILWWKHRCIGCLQHKVIGGDIEVKIKIDINDILIKCLNTYTIIKIFYIQSN